MRWRHIRGIRPLIILECSFFVSGVVVGGGRSAATYHHLNPVLLLKQINENLECLWKLAERPIHQQKKVKTHEVSVT